MACGYLVANEPTNQQTNYQQTNYQLTNYQLTNYQQTSKPNNKQERIKMKLNEAIKGMEVKIGERRENSSGKGTV